MSRCFPFPPPGYVKKGTTNDVDLLKKEKHREKKHKKEKKESKDKRKKEKSDIDNKEKRGDKEKDKEKDGDKIKYKNSITVEDEKKLAWKPLVHTGEILGLNGFSKTPGKVFGHSEDTHNQDNHRLVKDTEASKYVQDLGREVGDKEKGPVQSFTGADQKKEDKTVFELVTKDLSNGPEAMVKNMGRIDGAGSKVMSEFNGNTMLPGIFYGKTDLICKSIGSKAEGKTKTTKKEREDKHREKKSKVKDKNSEKEKKKEVKYDEMTREQDNPKVERNGYMGIYMPAYVKDVDMASDIQGHLRKRKDFGDFLGEANDISIEPNLRSGQVPEVPDGGAHRHLHPGMDPWQAPLVVDEKKVKVNGMIEGKPPPVTWSLSKLVPKKITPHPDTKYLDEVLSVPKMEEWSDQEWLSETWLKKPRIENICIDNESPPREVWDKGVLIDSADVYALPYVIPY